MGWNDIKYDFIKSAFQNIIIFLNLDKFMIVIVHSDIGSG